MHGQAQDEKVSEAIAAWRPRFLLGGIDLGQIERTLAKIERWDQWCAEWGRTAEHYEMIAGQAEEQGRMATAAHAWRQASRCWHFAKFVFTELPDQAMAANARAIACYARGAWALDPPATKVSIPYEGSAIPAYLRCPRSPAPYAPLVVMIPGLDSVKEEMEVPSGYLLERGMTTLAIDGPGQGELETDFHLVPHFESVVSACLDWAEAQSGLHVERVGLYGRSLGGHFACRAAAFDPRVRATVEVSGPYCMEEGWETQRELTRLTFQRRSGAADAKQARALAREFDLAKVAGLIASPLLVLHGMRDRLVTRAAAERIVAEAQRAELKVFEDGFHGLTNFPFEAGSLMADWLAGHLL